jgi:hypothetical protein
MHGTFLQCLLAKAPKEEHFIQLWDTPWSCYVKIIVRRRSFSVAALRFIRIRAGMVHP